MNSVTESTETNQQNYRYEKLTLCQSRFALRRMLDFYFLMVLLASFCASYVLLHMQGTHQFIPLLEVKMNVKPKMDF